LVLLEGRVESACDKGRAESTCVEGRTESAHAKVKLSRSMSKSSRISSSRSQVNSTWNEGQLELARTKDQVEST